MPDKDGDDEKKSTKSVVNKKQKPDIQTEGLKKIGKNVKNFFDKTLKFDSKYSNEPSVRSGARTPESTHMFKHVPSYNKDGTTGVYGQKGADFVKDKIKKGSKSLLDKGIEYVKNNPKQAGIIGAAAVGTGLAYTGIKGLQKRGERKAIAKSVVRQLEKKKMMGEEGYDIARDMGKVRPSKDKKDATTMPPSKEMEKTRKVGKGPSALERVKAKYGKSVMKVGKKKVKEELDLTQVAEAFGGYIVEAPVSGGKSKGESKKDKEDAEKAAEMSKKRGEFAKSFDKDPTQASDAEKAALGDRVGKADATKDYERVASEIDKPGGGPIKGRTPLSDTTKTIGPMRVYNPRKQAAKKQRISTALQGRKDMEGGERKNINPRKQGTPVKTETKPSKNASADVDKDAPYQFNTFKDSEMKKRKTFKQAFGQPTGADPKTGKPTYMRPGVLDKDGKPRPAQKRSKNLPDYDTVKTAVDMGLNPDEIDKNKFIDQEVRKTRMKRLGTPDPFDPDYDKKVKKVDQRTKIAKGFKTPKFQTAQRPLEVDRETAPDAEKIASQIKKTKIGFQDFDKKMRDAKVDADIERTIAGKNTRVSQTQVVGGGGGGNRNRTRTGTGTPDNPEVMKNGSAKNMIDVTNIKEPSKMSQAKDNARDFAKKDPVAALATYDLGKGLLGKILKTRLPRVPTPRAIQVSAKS